MTWAYEILVDQSRKSALKCQDLPSLFAAFRFIYGATSGVAAVVFYAYAFGQRFVPLKEAWKIL
jgi:hypothetical protein